MGVEGVEGMGMEGMVANLQCRHTRNQQIIEGIHRGASAVFHGMIKCLHVLRRRDLQS